MVGNPAPAFGAWGSLLSAVAGITGLVAPRLIGPWLDPNATSFFDLTPLRDTLLRMIDFDLLNHCDVRFAVAAVNAATGNYIYFDNVHLSVGPEHVMASVALPPAMPMVEIDGQHYWSGSLVSGTALQQILSESREIGVLVFQTYLFAGGKVPRSMQEVQRQIQNIHYSSRSRLVTSHYLDTYALRQALKDALERIPAKSRSEREKLLLGSLKNEPRVNILNLIYQQKSSAISSSDDFSRSAIETHWKSGYDDMVRALGQSGGLDWAGNGIAVSLIRSPASGDDPPAEA
jgi:NTE family protein